ncbi:MAG: hypothetical protein WBC92_19150 [Terracidiphilus sp.]
MNRCVQGMVTLALVLGPLACYGDSSYQETTQMTGGQLVDSLKNIPFMGKQVKSLTAPTTTTTMVHGNQKAVVTAGSTEIYDLDKQEIIHIDTAKKQYSVDTFADMRKMMAQMPDKIKQAQAQVAAAQTQPTQAPPSNLQFSFSVKVNDTGVQQVVNGLNAKQQIMTLTTIVTDTSQPGTSATYTVTTEIWTTPDEPEEMKDAQDFDVRFGQALMSGVDMSAYMNMLGSASNAGAAQAQMFAGQPGAAAAFQQTGKEMAKIQGTPILEKTSMGGSGTGQAAPQGGNGGGQSQGANADNGPVDTGTGGNVVAKGVTGLIGMFGKKKAQPASTTPASTTSAPQTPGETVLLETTTQKTNFSQAPIPASAFEVPAGFKQVPSALAQSLANQ